MADVRTGCRTPFGAGARTTAVKISVASARAAPSADTMPAGGSGLTLGWSCASPAPTRRSAVAATPRATTKTAISVNSPTMLFGTAVSRCRSAAGGPTSARLAASAMVADRSSVA